MTELDKNVRAAIRDEIDRMIVETESATLSLGENLEEIVGQADSFVRSVKSEVGSLNSEGDSSVSGALDEQCRIVEDFLGDLQSVVSSQSMEAEGISRTSEQVAEAARSVDYVSTQARILCVNTVIEAARLGDAGRPFTIIAAQMRSLSESIAESNQLISNLTTAIMPMLDGMKRDITKLEQSTGEFGSCFQGSRSRIEDVTENLHRVTSASLRLGDEKLGVIVSRSNSSLVSLQTQDIISQRLRRIISMLDADEAAVGDSPKLASAAGEPRVRASELVANGEMTAGYLSEHLDADGDEGGLSAGEMEFF